MRLRFRSRLPLCVSVFLVSLGCAGPEGGQTGAQPVGQAGGAALPPTAAAGAVAAQNVAATAAGSAALDLQRVVSDAQQIFGALPDELDSPTRTVTPEKIALGRQLYYEARLSKNQDLSCNSCHDLVSYGVDARAPVSPTSRGHKQQLGGRNAPTVYNAAGQIAQFWDGRAADVEAQAQGPVLNPVEMALPSAAQAVAVLESIPGYAPLFSAAFPSDANAITFENAAIAIGAFERKLITKDRFDQFLMGDTTALTMPEIEGLLVFENSGCAGCHVGPTLGGTLYGKLGVMKEYPAQDTGRYQVTMQDSDRHLFKVPTLRNIAKTGPYFHDGSIPTLEGAVRVMGEYQIPKGVLSEAEVASLVTFLSALTGELPTEYIKAPPPLPSGPATPAPDPS